MRVLVTGASGFLGRAVIARLDTLGLETAIVSRHPRAPLFRESVHLLRTPEDRAAVQAMLRAVEPQVVLHLAGTSSLDSYANLYGANVVFGANLLDGCLALPLPPQVLVTGSAAEYGPVVATQLPVDEDAPCRPNTAYGVSKLAQTAHAALARARGLAVVVARLFNPIGAGMPRTLALGSFAHQIAAMGDAGGALSTGDLDVVRDFIDVEAAADLLVTLALRHQGRVAIANLCTGQGHRLLDVTRRMTELAGVPIELRQDLSRRGNSDVRTFVGLPRALRKLGIEPESPDIDAILMKMLAHARSEATKPGAAA